MRCRYWFRPSALGPVTAREPGWHVAVAVAVAATARPGRAGWPACPPSLVAGRGGVAGSAVARRDLGRRLAGVRKAAGFTQEALAGRVGYSRSTVSSAEIGHRDIARVFWVRCDQVVKTPSARSFDTIRDAERGRAARAGGGRGPAGSDAGQHVRRGPVGAAEDLLGRGGAP